MAQNIPFLSGASGGQSPPVLSSQQQQQSLPNGTLSSSPPQPAPTMAQHAAFQQNALLSGLDMSELQGISPHQVAIIARLIQSGALQPLPEMPAQAPTANPSTSQIPAPEPQATGVSEPIAQEQDMDLDRDEGEIDEAEADTAKEPRGFLHPPPTGPRNLKAKQRAPQQNQRKPSPWTPIPSPTFDKSPALQSQEASDLVMNGTPNHPVQSEKEIQVKTFVLAMLKDGHSFNDILKLTGHPQPLARMFTQMHLEVPPEFSSTNQIQANGKPTTNAPLKRPAPVKPAASAKPLDRSEYLARLQAAKNKKVEPANPIAAATTVGEKIQASSKREVDVIQTPPPDVDAKKGTAKADHKTALLRQRLEALKAQHAAKQTKPPLPTFAVPQPTPNDTVPPTNSYEPAESTLQHSGLGAGLDTVAARALQISSFEQPQQLPPTLHQEHATIPTETALSPPPPTPTRSSGGLPGLFMFGQPAIAQQSFASFAATQSPNASTSSFQTSRMPLSSQTFGGTPTASPAELNVPRKRPVASDFDYLATKPKRPFGRSRGTSPAEPVVIITSSDEEDDDDDADDEMDTDNAAPPKTKLSTASFRDAAPLRDFPTRPTLHTQLSGQSTPGGSTPGGRTYEQRLNDIEEMKRKIAEKESRKNANGRTPLAQNLEATNHTNRSDAPSPAVPTTSESTPKVAELPPSLGTATSLGGMMSAVSPATPATFTSNQASTRPMSARNQERERLRQRLVELERDQSTYVNVATKIATDEQEQIDGLATSNAGTAVQVRSSPVIQETQLPSVPTEEMDELEAKEGEISDDSLFNFYSPADAQDVAAEESAPDDVRRVGSQISTASEMSIDDQAPTPDQSAFVDESQPAPVLPGSPMQTQLPDSMQQDEEVIELDPETSTPSPHVPGALPNINLEEKDEDAESEYSSQDSDSSDDDSQDLERSRLISAAITGVVRDIVEDDIGARLDIDVDDYEPSSPEAAEATSEVEVEDRADSTPSPAAESGAGTAEPAALDKAADDELALDSAMLDNAADDELAPELQPSGEEHAEAAIQTPAKPHFQPYESALRGFKDFRWHSDFLHTTSQGYQSQTFNHKIDANQPLCPFEGAGGQCNDPTCKFQHFKEMGLTDNELLKLLGTHNSPAHSADEHKRWNEGLGTVIKQLRVANVGRDVNAIAAAIAEYRKEFVGDPTTVLNLG